jgi:hypothetical protein
MSQITTCQNAVAGSLQLEIRQALQEFNPVLANLKITRCHYLLAQALQQALGEGAGANFHSWAVWGSRKAGVTIRQEDLDQARRDGSVVGSLVGALVGGGCGWLLGWAPAWLPAAALLGAGCGLAAGRLIIRRSRQRSADLILAGNRTVLEDIGLQTARFVDWLATPAPLADFLAELPAGPGRHELLRQAFTHYFEARSAASVAEKQRATYLGNCFAVWHEHVRLEPYIQGAMPLIIRRCVTLRLLQFDIGPLRLAVAQDVPVPAVLAEKVATRDAPALRLLRSMGGETIDGASSFAGTAARDWTRIRERMRYVFALFHAFHAEPQVCLAPYTPDQLAAIEAGQYPAGNWH